jgi:hypothetical protein
MQSSTVFRNQQLSEVSKSVLKLISNKIYPLNQEKMNRVLKHRRKEQLTRVNTEPTDSPFRTSKHFTPSKSSLHFEEKTMGEHFSQLETRDLLPSRMQNRDFELMTEKVNEFIWARRRELAEASARKEPYQSEELLAATAEKKSHLRRKSSNIEHCLVRLRKKLKEEFRRESEVYESPIFRFSEEEEKPASTHFNFLEEDAGIERVMERYPIRVSSRGRAREDPNRQFESDLLEEIKNSQSSDKYARMRISLNHRKIVSLR